MTTKQKVVIDCNPQLAFFDEIDTPAEPEKATPNIIKSKRRFCDPDASEIRLGNVPLKSYLTHAELNTPLVVANVLSDLDWSEFEERYASSGRPPYAPKKMMGLVLYGIMQGKTSLRALETLARLDVGAMWVSGGITPDHANIGRFINMHDKSITGEFFESLTRSVLAKTGTDTKRLAADGTTVEAACSHYKLIKEEAAKTAVEKAQKKMQAAPEDSAKQKALDKAIKAEKELQARKAKRKENGKDTKSLTINPEEVEAVMQKAKRGRGYAASYTPSVVANEKRVVTGQAVDPTSETVVIPEMLDQSERILGESPDNLMVDAGYFQNDIIDTAIERDINILCPEGKEPGQAKGSAKYQKGHFDYDEINDVYTCPAGEKLIPIAKIKDSVRTKGHTVYGSAPCEACSLQDKCTSSKRGRRIKRYANDEAKDALREVMRHPKAQKDFRQRKAMVEPVFSHLRQVQGLNRFRRKGLHAVKREFGLHLLAYNLSRAVALVCAFFVYHLLAGAHIRVIIDRT